jgi:outer membrane protein
MSLRVRLLFILLLLIYPSQAAQGSEQQSKVQKSEAIIEIGIGAFSVHLPQYLGSDQSDSYVVPLPYFYYLDDDFKVDRNQFTGKLWQDNNFYLDLSASAGLKVNSEDNTSRIDMPDLDCVFELGPSIKYYLTGDPQKSSYLYAEFLPVKRPPQILVLSPMLAGAAGRALPINRHSLLTGSIKAKDFLS